MKARIIGMALCGLSPLISAGAIYDVGFEEPIYTNGATITEGSSPDMPSYANAVTVTSNPGDMTSQAALFGSGSALGFYTGMQTAGLIEYSWDFVAMSLSGSLPLFQMGVVIDVFSSSDLVWVEYLSNQNIRFSCYGISQMNVATFTLGETQSYLLRADLDNDLLSFYIDGTPIVENQALPSDWDPYTINFATGMSASPSYALDNLSVVSIPEPSTIALFALGIPLLLARFRRK